MAMKWVKRIAIVLAVLLIVPMATLLVLGHRKNAGLSQTSVEISAAPDQVWAWLDDNGRLKQWVSWMVDARDSDPGEPHGIGTKRIWTMKDENNGGAEMEIAGTYSEYAPPSRMTLQIADKDGMFNGETSYRLVDLGGGRTRMEVRLRAHYTEWFANLMEPVITPAAEKKLAMDVGRLKRLVEARAAAR
jgi:uncharacterized protein YndB with AHSA1/START domain